MKLRLLALGALLATAASLAAVPAAPLLRPDDSWVALGDSITEDGQAIRWVEYYMRTRNAAPKFRAVNAGVGGDNAGAAMRRLDHDVLARRPTVVSVMFGMNDVGRNDYATDKTDATSLVRRRQSLERYEANLNALVKKLRAADVRVVLASPTSYEHAPRVPSPDFPGINAALKSCEDIMRKIGAAQNVPVANVHEIFDRWNTELQKESPDGSLIAPDRVHPHAAGQFVMAASFLEGAGLIADGQMVGFDAKTLAARGADAQGVRRTGSSWEMTLELSRLPLVPDWRGLPEGLVRQLGKRLGEDLLRVRSLPAGRHEIFADGVSCGVFTHAEWEEGVAFERMPEFPSVKQSLLLRETLVKKSREEAKLRVIEWSEFFAYPTNRPPVTTIDGVTTALRELRAQTSPGMQAAIDRRLENYPRFKAAEAKTQEAILALEATLAEQGSPAPVRLRIAPASH